MTTIAIGSVAKPATPEAEVKYWGLLAAFAALLIVCLLPTPKDLPVAGQFMLGMLLFSVILWMTEAVDYAISAVLIVALMAFLLGMAPDPAKPQAVLGTSAALGMALARFANTALALVAAALFILAATATQPNGISDVGTWQVIVGENNRARP